MNQTHFTNNSSIYLKQKRLRHLNTLSANNLQINSNRFNVWFTLHLTKNSRAFFISDKKENDRNPKWNVSNLNKFSIKEFLVRIWYSNLEENLNKHSLRPNMECRLTLLLELDVNMDFLFYLSESSLNYSVQNFSNLLVFEIFGFNFCEPFFLNEKTNSDLLVKKNPALKKDQQQQGLNQKNSYTLNLMIRLHDFQRVIHETKQKISNLKNNSLTKFDASSRLRQLQVKREEKLQRICLFKDSLSKMNQSIFQINETNLKLKESTKNFRQNLENIQLRLVLVKKKSLKAENQIEVSLKSNFMFKSELKLRQKQLINDLASVFQIVDSISNGSPNSNSSSLSVRLSKARILNTSLRLGTSNLSVDQENSVALGYISQSVQIISNILCVPLRYPILFRSSRSFIIEQFDETDVRKYALFKQSSTQDNFFMYAVSLLNVNIIQIRILYDSYRNVDQDDLVVNLKWIFDYYKS